MFRIEPSGSRLEEAVNGDRVLFEKALGWQNA
jgi:hypothetical protein